MLMPAIRRRSRGARATLVLLSLFALLAGAAGSALLVRAQDAAASAAWTLHDLRWLAGHWQGTQGSSAIEELWLAPSGGTMLAVSRTVDGERTVAFEYLRIEQRPDGIVYVAQPGGRAPTEFRLTALQDQSATFENPAHDFPQAIRYWRHGERGLSAEVSGDVDGARQALRFDFEIAALH